MRLRLLATAAFAFPLLYFSEASGHTPPPIPPTAGQLEAAHEIVSLLVPYSWDVWYDSDFDQQVQQWLEHHHPQSDELVRRVFIAKVGDCHTQAASKPDEETTGRIAERFVGVSEVVLRDLIAFLKTESGKRVAPILADSATIRAGISKRILPRLPALWAESVESAERLRKVNGAGR